MGPPAQVEAWRRGQGAVVSRSSEPLRGTARDEDAGHSR